jgi:hypothetical protein
LAASGFALLVAIGNSAAEGDDPATVHSSASLKVAVWTQAAHPTLGTPASNRYDLLRSPRR